MSRRWSVSGKLVAHISGHFLKHSTYPTPGRQVGGRLLRQQKTHCCRSRRNFVSQVRRDTGSSHSGSASSKAGVGLIFLRRADHRCGMTATRRRMRGCTLSPIGIWRRNRHRTLRLISASVGEWLRRRF